MRIIYLHQYFHTPAMHGSTRSYEMARRLVAKGHDVQMVTSDCEVTSAPDGTWVETHEGGIRVHWIGTPYSNTMSYPRRIRAFIRFARAAGKRASALGGDVVFATSTPLTIAIPAVRAAKRNDIPMVFEVRDLWPEVPIALAALRNPGMIWLARRLERYAYRNAREVVALSPGMAEGVAATGYPKERITVIPNSCDFHLFEVNPSCGQRLRRQHEWLGGRPLVIYTGTMGLVNGVDYLVRVANHARSIDPEVRFAIIGLVSREEKKVRSLAEECGILNDNFFMIPPVAKNEMPVWLSAANMTTSTFIDVKELWANSANKVFDSLAASRPIAINYGGWQADLIREHDCGLVLDPHNPPDAAQRLVEAVRDDAWLSRASSNARRLGREQFDRDELAERLEEVLVRAVSSRSRG